MQAADAQLSELSGRIKAAALAVGFDVVGITPALPFPQAEARLTSAVEAGLLTGLDWFDAERARTAADPRNMMQTAQSVVSVGLCYLTADSNPSAAEEGELRGRVAKYALGDDYHAIFRRKLRELLAQVQAILGEFALAQGLEARLLADTARIADRAAAQQAGVGWYGKNTNILTRRYGSWVLLGELLLTVPLAYDAPIPRDCGSCDLCLRACPTAALSPDDPYRLRANQCISYLTIELRGSIPRDLRAAMGDNIFGCDICQDVCPHNANVASRLPAGDGHPEFRAQVIAARPALLPLLQITEEQFRARFAGKPVRRAKREGLRRNVAIALGNSGQPAALPALIATLADPSAVLREHAAWAVGRIGGPAAVAALQAHLLVEDDPAVRTEIELSLTEMTTASEGEG